MNAYPNIGFNRTAHHEAHKNPNLIIERSVVKEIEYPIFNKIENKVMLFSLQRVLLKILMFKKCYMMEVIDKLIVGFN